MYIERMDISKYHFPCQLFNVVQFNAVEFTSSITVLTYYKVSYQFRQLGLFI